MKKHCIVLLLSLLFCVSCEKRKTYIKLIGEWSLYEYKLDGQTIDFGTSGSTLIFKQDKSGEIFKFPIQGGYLKLNYFTYTYEPKNNKLKFFYETNYVEEFEVTKLRASSGMISYEDEEDAPAQFLKIKNGKEEYYYEKKTE